jgi:hypothetical protein
MHTNQTELIFLYNELLTPSWQREMKIPLQFITFAFIEARLYTHYRNDSTFALRPEKRKWGSNIVYGAIFTLQDFEFYSRSLDAFHMCSMSTLGRNHIHDIHHRITTDATPIYFRDVHAFSHLKYREGEHVEVQAYMGNPNHPKITQRIQSKKHSHRIITGVDKPHFKELIREVIS